MGVVDTYREGERREVGEGGGRREKVGESGESNGFGRALYESADEGVGGGGGVGGELCEEALALFG